VSELAGWSDHALEAVGRLAEPLSYNPATDKYEPISWDDVFALVAETLQALGSPNQASFYTSGRLSNKATFLYENQPSTGTKSASTALLHPWKAAVTLPLSRFHASQRRRSRPTGRRPRYRHRLLAACALALLLVHQKVRA
jgi:hypothetical protein